MTTTENKKILNRFLIVGFAEGISYLVLLLIAMPLKYLAGWPAGVKVVGMLHGILFVAFCITLLHAAIAYSLGIKKVIIAFLLSLIPFGTFFLEKTLRNEYLK